MAAKKEAKLSVHKKVYWKAAGKDMSGKVKQILGDHVVVKADDSDYIVHKASLSTKA